MVVTTGCWCWNAVAAAGDMVAATATTTIKDNYVDEK